MNNRRSTKGVDFARQLFEQRREAQRQQQQPATKKFKSYDPKGTKLASGYQDRAQLRREAGESDAGDDDDDIQDKERRVRALEELVKQGQIDQATFERLRAEIGVGGDVRTAGLVKGLDWELLRRVKAGEDVTKPVERPLPKEDRDRGPAPAADVDEEFDRVLEEKEKEEVVSVAPKEKVKKGNLAPAPAEEAGPQKKSRDEILRQLKESRARAAAAGAAPAPAPEPPVSTLGSKFKKIGDARNEKKRWIEQDETGRRKEVLITTDADGKTKRKVRWLDPPKPAQEPNGDKPNGNNDNGLLMPNKDVKPLGMEVPAEFAAKAAAAQEEDEDDDIFAGVGTDYNPLADIAEDDASSSSESEAEEEAKADKAAAAAISETEPALADAEKKKETAAPQPPKPRNYFSTSTTTTTETPELDRSNPFTKDPTIMEALKRAAKLRQASPSADLAEGGAEDGEDVDPEALLRRKKFLEEARRREALDNADLDLGFGESRIEDDEDDEYYEGRSGQKRKRGPKKRKGNKDSVTDVMRVLEGRRKAEAERKGKA